VQHGETRSSEGTTPELLAASLVTLTQRQLGRVAARMLAHYN
jgi:hypothetical protein